MVSTRSRMGVAAAQQISLQDVGKGGIPARHPGHRGVLPGLEDGPYDLSGQTAPEHQDVNWYQST